MFAQTKKTPKFKPELLSLGRISLRDPRKPEKDADHGKPEVDPSTRKLFNPWQNFFPPRKQNKNPTPTLLTYLTQS